MPNKQASILLEVIVSIAILSLVMINAMFIYQEFYQIKKDDFQSEISNIELLNTKYFLQKNIQSKTDLHHLKQSTDTLYFDEAILLQDVSSYTVTSTNQLTSINICIKNKICKTIVLRL